MLEIVHQTTPSGASVIGALGRDDLVRSLLLLYGLHPETLETRVGQALEKTRPYLKSHSGNVTLVRNRRRRRGHVAPGGELPWMPVIFGDVEAGGRRSHLRCGSGRHRHPGRKPNAGKGTGDGLRSLSSLNGNGYEAKIEQVGWEDVFGLDAIPSGTLRAEDVGGRDILFCRLEETLYAYNNICPGCGQPLGAALMEGSVLACPICSQHYDVGPRRPQHRSGHAASGTDSVAAGKWTCTGGSAYGPGGRQGGAL